LLGYLSSKCESLTISKSEELSMLSETIHITFSMFSHI
jgi:hypothetical protein